MTIFSFFLFLGFAVVAGLAIDLVRSHTMRIKLQSVADNAVLAAVTSAQVRDRQQVVADYFEAAGLSQYLVSSVVDSPDVSPEVTAEARALIPTSFLRLAGISGFPVEARASATEMISAVEVSLVLDISGSMSGIKLWELKAASAAFVGMVYQTAPMSESHISIVPYAGQVNAGADVLTHMNTTADHSYSHCVDFEEEDFLTSGMSLENEFQQAAHFDPYSSASHEDLQHVVCNTNSHAEVLAYSNNIPALLAKIFSLQARGSTSIDTGMKWGTSLLDLQARPVVQGMIDDGNVSSDFVDRPVDPTNYPGIKIIVLMTDGQNTTQYRIKPEFSSGLSDVWKDNNSGHLSIEEVVPPSDYYNYCTTYLGGSSSSTSGYWQWLGWGQGWGYVQPTGYNCSAYQPVTGYYAPHNSTWYDEPYGNDPFKMTYPELWNEVPVRHHAQLRYEASGSTTVRDYWEDEPITYVSGSEKNDRLLDICTAAKGAGILVYTVAVEAPESSDALLSQCATSPSHHFTVDRFEIDEAFGAIITNVTHLRLTQ